MGLIFFRRAWKIRIFHVRLQRKFILCYDMENVDKTPATFESMWKLFRESERQRQESAAKFDHEIAEISKQQAETGRKIDKLNETVNGMSKSDGLFAEEYFFNAFENGKRTFEGETFDEITKNLKGTKSRDEYDIVLINGKSVGIIEVKYRGRMDVIPKIINKTTTFRANYPKFQHHRIFLALASMMFNQRLEDECKENGIAIIRQAGDTVVINGEHLKAY